MRVVSLYEMNIMILKAYYMFGILSNMIQMEDVFVVNHIMQREH